MIRPAKDSDWPFFDGLVVEEGWRVPQYERRQFLGAWSRHARVLEVDAVFCGMVTAVPHERSGWIGNLIVPPRLRGRGHGRRLFQAASDSLAAQGLASQWLTASRQGRQLYEKYGFMNIDTIERWVSPARHADKGRGMSVADAESRLRSCDRSAWGERRSSLLDSLVAHGRVFACDDAVALLQKASDMQVIGPWYAPNGCPRANRRLLQEVLASADDTVEVVTDVLRSSPLRSLLAAAGFDLCGESDLMMKGDPDAVETGMMVSLASLGSVG